MQLKNNKFGNVNETQDVIYEDSRRLPGLHINDLRASNDSKIKISNNPYEDSTFDSPDQ
jgi:hypothetical protein